MRLTRRSRVAHGQPRLRHGGLEKDCRERAGGPHRSDELALPAPGTFLLQGMIPRRYRIACDAGVAPDGTESPWRLESVRLGDRTLADARLTLQTTDLSGLVLTLTTRPLPVKTRGASGQLVDQPRSRLRFDDDDR
jgi:hypothetical protein